MTQCPHNLESQTSGLYPPLGLTPHCSLIHETPRGVKKNKAILSMLEDKFTMSTG